MDYETSRREMQWAGLLGGLALGALAMYLADPSQGRRRRALLQDQFGSITHKSSHAMRQKLHDTRKRLSGLKAEATQLFARRDAKPIDDHVLAARVRSRLGRHLPYSPQIDVTAEAGCVTLSGPVDAEEMARLVHLAQTIPGVESVAHHLREEGSAKSFRQSILSSVGIFQGHRFWWLAGALAVYSISRRAPGGLAAVASLGMLARVLGKTEGAHRQMAGSAAMQETTQETEQSIDINAAPETVFDVWSNFENFPHFMSHVMEVRDLGQQRSHWIIRGPAGTPVEWNAVLTVSERPHRLAWQAEPGSGIEQHGSIQLDATESGTRATVRMVWQSAAGIELGQMLTEDLQRLKQFIENGLPVRETVATGKERGPLFH